MAIKTVGYPELKVMNVIWRLGEGHGKQGWRRFCRPR